MTTSSTPARRPASPYPSDRGARANIGLLFWSVGLLMGLFARDIIAGDVAGRAVSNPTPIVSAERALFQPEVQPLAVNVRAVLELPSPTPVPLQPTVVPNLTPDANYCTDVEPGAVCKVPYPPPPTPTPLPSCHANPEPGTWCRWPETALTPTPQSSTAWRGR